jgi:hypothetical protein
VVPGSPEVEEDSLPTGARLATDASGYTVILFLEPWNCDFFMEHHPKVQLSALPVGLTDFQDQTAAVGN